MVALYIWVILSVPVSLLAGASILNKKDHDE
jgi:hypothetical protein